MWIAILIIVVLVIAAATVLMITRGRATTGGLSRETRKRDAGTPDIAAETTSASTELELQGRERADDTRSMTGGEVAKRAPGGVARYEPVDEEELGVTRRHFLNLGVLTLVGFSASVFGAAVLGFLWPTSSGGFGGKVAAGKLSDILAQIASTQTPFYVPLARTYINPYPAEALPKAQKIYKPAIYSGMQQGVVGLYQKCVHLGCRVPWCKTSQWFECPCHGSKYNRVGEKRDGPAPRGLDRWPLLIAGGAVTVDTSGSPVTGPPIGTDTTGQKPEGPHCI